MAGDGPFWAPLLGSLCHFLSLGTKPIPVELARGLCTQNRLVSAITQSFPTLPGHKGEEWLMTGSARPSEPFVHSLGDTSWVLLRANPALGTQRARNIPPPARKQSQHLPPLRGEARCCPTRVGRGQALCARRACTLSIVQSEAGPVSGAFLERYVGVCVKQVLRAFLG